MTIRTTITLDEDITLFLNAVAGSNKSAYINTVLKAEQQRLLAEKITKANREEAEDSAYRTEVGEWDATLSDGLPHDS